MQEKERCKKVLKESKMLAGAFAYLVLDITLLKGIHQVLGQVGEAIDDISSEIDDYQGSDLLGHLQEMNAINYLDEMVDFEPVSELEAQFYEITGGEEREELSGFLMQFLDKIEKAHSVLVEKLHEFNALLDA